MSRSRKVRRTPEVEPRNSCKVQIGGRTIGLRVSSGGLSGNGIEASIAKRALTMSAGSSDTMVCTDWVVSGTRRPAAQETTHPLLVRRSW